MSTPSVTRDRCCHISRNRRPCRYLALVGMPYCKHHRPDSELAGLHNTLTLAAENFESPQGVCNVLYTLFFAAFDGHISERRAGVLTYLAQTALNALRAEAEYNEAEDQRELEAARRRAYARIASPPPPQPPPPAASASPKTQPSSPAQSSPASDDRVPHPTTSSVGPGSPSSPVPAAPTSSLSEPPIPLRHPERSEGSLPAQPAPAPPPNLNHFFPRDPTLPASLQDPATYGPPPPSPEELARRHARFDRAHGFRPSPAKRVHPLNNDPDWKLINGR